ncbi:hypothetical protein GBAR_LOCUS25513 [Geodia barretti]|uniref:Fibronectin type-III domain-containing protein n=1 Tax=Geodia barretti TaxID=519541 RepID=A0AA35TFG8_GEOBA|nr:hypothetical protein GBAR_LOCUS25513 [Geodia barretti]
MFISGVEAPRLFLRTRHHPHSFRTLMSSLPLAPGEVEVVGERVHQLRVTWTPPFSLPGELISYSLLISERQALDCHRYSFSAFSLNDVGLSLNSSSSTPALHPSAPGPLGAVTTEVSHNSQQLSDSRAVLRLSFQRPESCFPLNYTLTLSEEGGPEEVIAVQVTGSESAMVAEVTGLKENSHYSATLSASNHFQFSMDDPVTTEVSFVTSGLQSVAVFHYVNGTARITCVFATGSLSSGCLVSLVLDSSTTTNISIDREEGAVEVVRYSSIGGVPQSVTGRDLGVDNPLEVRGEVSDEGDPTPTTDETDVTSHDTPVTSSPPSATPTSDPTTEPSSSTSDLTGLLQWVIPAGVGVAVLALCVMFVGFCVCCRQSSKHRMRRHSTLPRRLPVPHSPASPAYSHDYKQVPPPHVSGTIKEMSFTPHSMVAASRRAAKLAANPKYGAVGGANGATPNPQYGAPPSQQVTRQSNEEHMYASLKDPRQLLPTQTQSLQYAQPYEHVASSHAPPPSEGVAAPYALPSPGGVAIPPGGVVILTDDNVSYNASPPLSSVDSPHKSP